ncbi:Red chlorophyll catabolite reductase (RCC reductase) [Cylindrospermum stagnale PCC 7417]|uniref:Red chlorophyll catabolite reductase (RCC reductase) n=1 Tax=Cylindrospermum stagnale PCC 7417 TaxID=56107 RepID=K9WRU2_9NOST|nr:Red chlorophyll catabolite reductase (RCC reductase) [Cylindrospermum stagnale]AFZ22933.1 Red chlorophyll catabolite reductase (RCC reductase) [Cylindrospermum stagnale PCC 7417]
MLEQQPDPNIFQQLWTITNELRQKLEARFSLNPESSTQDLREYSSLDGKIRGSLTAFSGEEIDWLVHSWLGNPEKLNFNTMRLTTWLGPHIKVPHLAFEFGTVPNLFFYMDYIPRIEMLTDLDYLERYYEPVNQTFLKLQADQRLVPFTSKSVYVRLFQSPISLCYTSAPSEDALELTRTVAHEMLDRWLIWVEEAEPVPSQAREALAARDFWLRRTSAEADPGNKLAVQLLGGELTDKLVRSLWGGIKLGGGPSYPMN